MKEAHKIRPSWIYEAFSGVSSTPKPRGHLAAYIGGYSKPHEFPLITHPAQVLVALGRIKPNHDTQTYTHRETGAELKPADCVPTEEEYIEYVKFALNLK